MLLLKTAFGEIKVDSDDFTDTRTMNFKKAALTISGLNIDTIDYQLELQANLPPNAVRNFEKHLLNGPHSFERKDVDGIVRNFSLSKYFPKAVGIHFFAEDSEAVMIEISPSSEGKRSFWLRIWDDKAEHIDDDHSWEIKVGADDDILGRALKYICTVAEAIRKGKLQCFISKMNMVNG